MARTRLNLGCLHSEVAYGHCGEMSCVNYQSKCSKHAPTGSSTAICNLEHAKAIGSMSQETRDQIYRIIELNPALEASVLRLAELAFVDGQIEGSWNG